MRMAAAPARPRSRRRLSCRTGGWTRPRRGFRLLPVNPGPDVSTAAVAVLRTARDRVFATLPQVPPVVTNIRQYDDGIDPWPPGWPMANAAADWAAWMASARGAPATRLAAQTAVNASLAPVVSTGTARGAGYNRETPSAWTTHRSDSSAAGPTSIQSSAPCWSDCNSCCQRPCDAYRD